MVLFILTNGHTLFGDVALLHFAPSILHLISFLLRSCHVVYDFGVESHEDQDGAAHLFI